MLQGCQQALVEWDSIVATQANKPVFSFETNLLLIVIREFLVSVGQFQLPQVKFEAFCHRRSARADSGQCGLLRRVVVYDG
jgi:hypothetical protein